jgi:tetratricopeptide (TPR) repeat protein
MLDYHLAARAFNGNRQYTALKRVAGITPTAYWVQRLAGAALDENRPREALDLLTALEADDKLSGYYIDMIDAKMALGDWDAVLADIERVRGRVDRGLPFFPREVEALARLGRADEAVEKSLGYLQSTRDPERHDLWSWFPMVLRGTGLREQARIVAERSVTSLREMEDSRPFVFAKALVLAGNFDEARRELEGIGDTSVNAYQKYALLAYMAARQGDSSEATRLSKKAREVAEAGPAARVRFAAMSQVEVAAHLGDFGGAVRLLWDAFELGIPKGSWVLTRWDLTPLYSYQPFAELIRPKG